MRSLSQGASVRYSLAVINPDGSVERALPPRHNLLLDSGLDGIAARSWWDSFSRAVVGTSAVPVKRDSGLVTFTRAGNVVTASANFFEAADVGRLLKFDSGEEMYISGYSSTVQVTVNASGTLAASEATVWYVNQTGLLAETKRTSVTGSESGDNGSTWQPLTGSWLHKRTFIFSAESGAITYREIGWSHTDAAGNNLLGRDSITGGISLTAGQQLKVVMELTVNYSPVTPTAYANVITGWTQSGQQCIEGYDESAFAPHGGSVQWSLSTTTTPLAPPSGPSRDHVGTLASVALVAAAYTAGTFRRDYTGTFSVVQANRTDWRSMGIGGNPGGGQFRCYYRILLDAAETKDSAHTLTFTLRLSWGRILVN